MNIPMLNENEWQKVAHHLGNMTERIKEYLKKHQCSLAEARKGAGLDACAAYYEITGFQETEVNALYHHQINLYGPSCDQCRKPLRTPRAKHCAACGAERKT